MHHSLSGKTDVNLGVLLMHLSSAQKSEREIQETELCAHLHQ